MNDARCAGCGGGFTDEEWLVRHSDEMEEFHPDCCPSPTCQQQRPGDMKRSFLPPRRAPLRRRRPDPATNKDWRKVRSWVVDRAKGLCEARINGVCTRRGEHAHHVRLRSRGGRDDPDNLVLVCHACHGWVHENPLAATELGLMR